MLSPARPAGFTTWCANTAEVLELSSAGLRVWRHAGERLWETDLGRR